MNADTDNIQYARTQLEESRRRFESVKDRIAKTPQKKMIGVIDKRVEEFVPKNEINDIPEKYSKYIVTSEKEEEIMEIKPHLQNIIIDCQMSVELSVKSMFKAVDQDFDYSHDIGFSSHNTQGFNSEMPADFPRKKEVIRAIFLTQLWEKYYEIAKYGAPELNVGADLIFDIEDGERAINDASFCVGLAEEFLDYVEE